MHDETSGLKVPERILRPPNSVSPQAQTLLSFVPPDPDEYPPLDDLDAWRRRATSMGEMLLPQLEALVSDVHAEVTTLNIGGVTVYDVTPAGIPEGLEDCIHLYLHGGALFALGGACCRAMAIRAAQVIGLRTWSVDYRMPPDHPFPAPLDDCVAVYRQLLQGHQPRRVVVQGGSAGGNLAAAMVLRARDEGLPLPAAAVLLSPEVDLTESGDSFQTLIGVDSMLRQSLMPANLLYAGGHELTHPYISPLFGDYGAGFPPTFLQSGTRDLFLSNTVRLHRALLAANVPAELHVFEAMPHGFFATPEEAERDGHVRRFAHEHLSPNPSPASQSAPLLRR